MISQRFKILDQIRGLAVLLMIFFHFCYDLSVFHFVKIDFSRDSAFWWGLPRVIVFLFFFSMGASLTVAHSQSILWRKFLVREAKLLFFALLISLGTFFFFRERWVYFGTLHSILISSFFVLPFVRLKWSNFIVGGLIFLVPIMTSFKYPWFIMEHSSMDYIPPFPWVGVALMGMAFQNSSNPAKLWIIPENKGGKVLEFCGKNALSIYVLHQPILFALVWSTYKLLSF
jgi:uncharacterized membrane protein